MTSTLEETTVVPWDEFDLQTAWFDAVRKYRQTHPYWGNPSLATFVDEVRSQVSDPDSVEVVQCPNCNDVIREEDAETVNGTDQVCASCYEDYRPCDDCGDSVHYDETTYTLHDETVCQSCSERYYGYCEECDGYYHVDREDEHNHSGCDCESPAQVFTMRNDGEPLLNQDERVTIALPSGVISPEGLDQIRSLISGQGYNEAEYDERMKWWHLANDLDALGAEWQTREGNYTKRLSKLAHKTRALKIPPAMISEIGNIGRANSTGVDFQIETTRDLNQSASDFYHDDSCWWQSYSESRCSLKQNGGIGLRTFDDNGYVQGRAWILPLRADESGNLQPTFDSMGADAFMVFNGYGDLSGYTPARIVSHMAGMTYRKIAFTMSPMYVNNSTGYLVASEEIATRYATAGRLTIHAATHSNLHADEAAAAQAAA